MICSQEVKRIKAENPELDHRKAFKMAASNVRGHLSHTLVQIRVFSVGPIADGVPKKFCQDETEGWRNEDGTEGIAIDARDSIQQYLGTAKWLSPDLTGMTVSMFGFRCRANWMDVTHNRVAGERNGQSIECLKTSRNQMRYTGLTNLSTRSSSSVACLHASLGYGVMKISLGNWISFTG